MRSSGDAWLTSSTEIEPNPRTYPELGFPGPAKDLAADKKGSQVLGVAVVGGFTSSVAKPAEADKAKTEADKAKPDDKAKDAPRLIEHSPPDARIVVFGSSAFVSDDILQVAQQLDSDLALANVELVHNAVDWSMADTELLSIRSRTAATRVLTAEASSYTRWVTINVVIAAVGLGLVIGYAAMRRRSVLPITPGKEA